MEKQFISEQKLEKIMSDLQLSDSAKTSLREFQKLSLELHKESDRGMTLYATAYLDYQLEILLKKKLVGSKKELTDLFSFNGPLGTFSSKIKISYSIGLLDKDTVHDIDILRKIRNVFAHSEQKVDLNSENVTNLINNLKLVIRKNDEGNKEIFINVVSRISGRISSLVDQIVKFVELNSPELKNDI